jgi:hypothetical protein
MVHAKPDPPCPPRGREGLLPRCALRELHLDNVSAAENSRDETGRGFQVCFVTSRPVLSGGSPVAWRRPRLGPAACSSPPSAGCSSPRSLSACAPLSWSAAGAVQRPLALPLRRLLRHILAPPPPPSPLLGGLQAQHAGQRYQGWGRDARHADGPLTCTTAKGTAAHCAAACKGAAVRENARVNRQAPAVLQGSGRHCGDAGGRAVQRAQTRGPRCMRGREATQVRACGPMAARKEAEKGERGRNTPRHMPLRPLATWAGPH